MCIKIIPVDMADKDSVALIRASFQTVAEELGLDESNCPSHPSFITREKLQISIDGGLQCFTILKGDQYIGFVGMKKLNAREYTLEKLAVLPSERHHGYGRMLIEHICQLARKSDGKEVHIGIIDEHTVLKQWYQSLGFNVIETRQYDRLPFRVCMMKKIVTDE